MLVLWRSGGDEGCRSIELVPTSGAVTGFRAHRHEWRRSVEVATKRGPGGFRRNRGEKLKPAGSTSADVGCWLKEAPASCRAVEAAIASMGRSERFLIIRSLTAGLDLWEARATAGSTTVGEGTSEGKTYIPSR
jgi:hypothetical protein